MAGLIHLYCGDGKGKTTASVGLSVRAAGAGKKVLFTQFFKSDNSSEIAMLRLLPGITVQHCPRAYGFFRNMTPEQRQAATADFTQLLRDVLSQAPQFDLLVLDECVSACNRGVIPEQELLDFLRSKPQELEVVMTGREPSQALQDTADYITEMKKLRHPFDKGIAARKGVEF